MLRKRIILAALAASALAGTLGVPPAQGQEAKSGPPAGQSDQAVLRAEAAAGRSVAPSDSGAERATAAVQANIARWVQRNGPKHSFATYLDRSSGRIVLRTDAPGPVVSQVVGEHGRRVDVRAGRVADLYSRKDDVPAYWGGAGITASTGTPWCSSGFTVQNGAGTRFLTTAGHCFANGTTVRTELGGRIMGTVSGRGLPSNDMERIGGATYSPYIYVGGTSSSSGMPVVGAGDSVVGYGNYCHSGRTTGENCGHTSQSNFAQVCTSSGCKYPVTAFTGGTLPQGGDSGSPFYVKDSTSVWIRGMVIAGDGTTSYAEKYSRISSFLGVTIVT